MMFQEKKCFVNLRCLLHLIRSGVIIRVVATMTLVVVQRVIYLGIERVVVVTAAIIV
jgi:hypothetical protein